LVAAAWLRTGSLQSARPSLRRLRPIAKHSCSSDKMRSAEMIICDVNDPSKSWGGVTRTCQGGHPAMYREDTCWSRQRRRRLSAAAQRTTKYCEDPATRLPSPPGHPPSSPSASSSHQLYTSHQLVLLAPHAVCYEHDVCLSVCLSVCL